MPAKTFDRNGDHTPTAKAGLQQKLHGAAVLEAKVGEEIERLLSLAFEQGWTDDEICVVTGFDPDDIARARRRGGKLGIYCKGCGVPVPRSGRRGMPRQWCTGCKP